MVSRDQVDQGSRFANPSADADADASANSTKANPLSMGKKDVTPSTPQEWGSLRYGVPKDGKDFGLPEQKLPANANDPNGNDADAGSSVEASQEAFAKGSQKKGNNPY